MPNTMIEQAELNQIMRWLSEIEDAQLEGTIVTRDEAMSMARERL